MAAITRRYEAQAKAYQSSGKGAPKGREDAAETLDEFWATIRQPFPDQRTMAVEVHRGGGRG